MHTHEARCPSCAETIYLPTLQHKATATFKCPGCRTSLQVQLDRFPALPLLSPIALPASSDENQHHHPRAPSTLGLTRCGNTLVSSRVCAHCQQPVTEYRFAARGGFSIATYHCTEHGDVIPTHGVGAHHGSATYCS